MRWKFYHGLCDELYDYFKSCAWLSAEDAGLPGFVDRIQKCEWPVEDSILSMYREANKDGYEAYWKSVSGLGRGVPVDSTSVKLYIEENGLSDEYGAFRSSVRNIVVPRLEPQEIRSRMVEESVSGIFDKMRRICLCIYRQSDGFGIIVFND